MTLFSSSITSLLVACLLISCEGELEIPYAEQSSALYDDGAPPPLPSNPTTECSGDPGTNEVCFCNSGAPIVSAVTVNKFINNAARWAGFSDFIVRDSKNEESFTNIIDTSQY